MRRLALLVLLGLTLTACASQGGTPTSGTLRVVAAFYPLAYAAQQVLGDAATVSVLAPPGVEPHDIELTPQQAGEVADADLVLYIPGFQPALDAALEGRSNALDVTRTITELPGPSGGTDPHVWLNPLNMAAMGAEIGDRLASIPGVAARQLAFSVAMDALNAEWGTGTRSCTQHTLVVSHDAFAYLAAQYGFTQEGIAGLSPDAEPSPARIAQIADLVTSQGITTIYYEALVDRKVAQTIAAETGATTALLDPIEGIVAGSSANYVSLMQTNLQTIRTGQGCA
jgi:zinc transport system substrate-binding protein